MSIIVLILALTSIMRAQALRVNIDSRPLNEALTTIGGISGIMLSFNPEDLNKYIVSADTTFENAEEAVRFFLTGLPFRIKRINGVTVIAPATGYSRVSGVVSERSTGERLPYALIIIDSKRYMADENGYFSVPADKLSSLLKVRYLGYSGIDTLISSPAQGMLFYLEPSATLLKEALLEGYETGNALQSGNIPGVVKMNHIVSAYLPGNGDNSIFNLMRMMPGVRSVGEQSGLSVWGSKPGESTLLFDGVKLFSMNGYNEQISLVNPFMVKDITLHKGAYDTQFGNQTGAIAEVVGITGNNKKGELKFNLNNQTANIFTSLPLGNGNVVAASYRQTFYGLFSPLSSGSSNGNGNGSSRNEIQVNPDYTFRDANIRLTGNKSGKRSYKISLMGSKDNFLYNLLNENVQVNAYEKNMQFAGLASVSFTGVGGGALTFEASHSMLSNSSKKIVNTRNNNSWMFNEIKLAQDISETFARTIYAHDLLKNGRLRTGIEGFRHSMADTAFSIDAYRFSLFADQEFVLKNISLKGGARADYYSGRIYIQPRASVRIDLWNGFKFNIAWGLYNQFTGKVVEIFEEVAPVYVWKIFGYNGTPVVKSMHSVGGIGWSNNKFNFSVELFDKRSRGVSQIIRTNQGGSVLTGESVISGADIFAKWEFRGNQIFSTLSYGIATEKYSEALNYKYNPFEFKSGAVINLSPFWLSAGYVYGNGYMDSFGTGRYSSMSSASYSRLDLSATYQFALKRIKFRLGASVLNVLNTQNKKTLEVIPLLQRGQGSGQGGAILTNLYAEAVPFSPAVYIEISF